MIKRFFAHASAVFAIVYLWKIALLAFFVLPVPANDAFFYDGPVVNLLTHGTYANPSLALALPISGTKVFSAYPPLYQCVLLGWMTCLGTSVVSAMVLHLVLFGAYALLLLALLKRLRFPVWTVHIAAGYLLLITFHDRPDSLAHVFGMGALYCWVRSWRSFGIGPNPKSPSPAWGWGMAICSVLAFAAGLQIGVLYTSLLVSGIILAFYFAGERPSWGPVATMCLTPGLLVGVVIVFFPELWAGFLEHAHATPSLTGWRLPRPDEVLKLLRTVPGLLWGVLVLGLLLRRVAAVTAIGRNPSVPSMGNGLGGLGPDEKAWLLVSVSSGLACLAMLAAAMFLLTSNSVLFTLYLQPLAVAGALALWANFVPVTRGKPLMTAIFIGLLALGGIRAVGLSTWGVACAADVPCSRALKAVDSELRDSAAGTRVVLSSAYLYGAMTHKGPELIHSDWLQGGERDPDADWRALQKVRPTKLILTQFDFFRRYEPLLARLREHPELAAFQVANTAKVAAPDSFKSLRRVLQHVSWAPVVVHLEWK